jgi:hypothetical protein
VQSHDDGARFVAELQLVLHLLRGDRTVAHDAIEAGASTGPCVILPFARQTPLRNPASHDLPEGVVVQRLLRHASYGASAMPLRCTIR